jgi:small subunit ribosomal protein S4
MARYTGPTSKIARKFRDPIFGPDKALSRRNYPPGQHGNSKRNSKKSEYAVQLTEKQKAKYTYGVLERQFRKTFELAARKKGRTGDNLLRFLESRLDNVVFRLGIAPTRRAARQLVSHRHINVNGNIVNIASYQVRPGDVISVREKSKSNESIVESLAGKTTSKYGWLTWNASEMSGTFIDYPERESIPENIREQLIVELYSK